MKIYILRSVQSMLSYDLEINLLDVALAISWDTRNLLACSKPVKWQHEQLKQKSTLVYWSLIFRYWEYPDLSLFNIKKTQRRLQLPN